MHSFIYLDNSSTTQPDDRVISAMNDCFRIYFANPSSFHRLGREANSKIKHARQQLSSLINCSPNDIVFTSGATESINLGIKAIVEKYKKKGNHIITSETEHSAVLNTYKYLEKIGYEVTYLPVKADGLIDIDLYKNSIRQDTILVSIMYANNETGVIQPIKKMVEIAHFNSALFFCDATQAVGKIPIDVQDLNVDLLCFSGHKFHGPKGIGGLYYSSNRINLIPQIHGGDQEKGIRSGTLNVPGICGIGCAAEIAQKEMASNEKRIRELRDYLESELLKIQGSTVNGNTNDRLHSISNICFNGLDANDFITKLDNIMVSNGSACTASLVEPSHVLTAMGLSDTQAFSAIRFSLGNFNSKEEIDVAIKNFKEKLCNEQHFI